MKVAFPLKNEKELAKDFAHAHHIGIYDDVKNKIDMISITEIERVSSVIVFFDLLTSIGLQSIVSPSYSYMSLRVFKENQIETFKAVGIDLIQNIELVKDKRLNLFDVYESLINDDCISDCGSCGTSCSSN